jgi:2'-5' RNA ligase
MPESEPEPELIRSFVGIPLDEAGRVRLGELQNELRGEWRGMRWVDPALLHLTLVFLGDVEAKRLRELGGILSERLKCRERFRARLQGLGVYPTVARPRVLWVGVGGEGTLGAFQELHGEVKRAVDEAGIASLDERFHPHVTLGRVKPGHRLRADATLERWQGLDLGAYPVEEVVLYRSDLGPGGSRYTRLSEVELGVKSGS